MSARSLLTALFGISLLLICAFTVVTFQILWDLLGPFLPDTITVFEHAYPTLGVIYVAAAMLYTLIALLFCFLYLLLDRSIITPVKAASIAMHEFSAHGRQVILPKLDRSIREVASFVDAFRGYTDNVEKVHERDMEISRMKSDFISTAAHQLRTPMTGIRWSLEALEKTPITEEQRILIESAADKSHDLVGIIGTLLDISSIESGKYKYKFEPMDAAELVEEITHDFLPLAQARQISLYYAKGNLPLARVKADRDRIKWILNNLVENAIRYTPAGGSVQLYIDAGFGRLFVHVKDTGIGIKQNDRANIFERFYRAQNAVQKENAGNGLGLYIARTIARDHGGDLNFEANTEGPGTTFTLSLPIVN